MEQIKLPIKTKIAAAWLITITVISVSLSLYIIIKGSENMFFIADIKDIIIIPLSSLLGLIIAISAYYLLRRKRWAWFVLAAVSLGLMICFGLSARWTYVMSHNHHLSYLFLPIRYLLFFMFVNYLIPFILLFVDRKNFFKFAS